MSEIRIPDWKRDGNPDWVLTNEHDVVEGTLFDPAAHAEVGRVPGPEVFVTKEGTGWRSWREGGFENRLNFTFVAVPIHYMREGLRLSVVGERLNYHVHDHVNVVGAYAVLFTSPLPHGM